jgi:hypothetical protein
MRDSAQTLPIYSFAAGDDAVHLSLALADLPIGLLVRLRAGRCFYQVAASRGIRQRTHGPDGRGAMEPRLSATVVCGGCLRRAGEVAATDGQVVSATDPRCGSICLQAWSGLRHPTKPCHARDAPTTTARAGHADPPRRRPPPRPHHSADAAVALLVCSHSTELSGDLAGLHRPLLAGADLAFLQADAALDDAQTTLTTCG